MYPYGYYQGPQTPMEYNPPYEQTNPYILPEEYDPDRQPPQFQQLERRVTRLERENDRQAREIDRLQRRLQRVNQRLRAVERRFNFPFTPFDGEY